MLCACCMRLCARFQYTAVYLPTHSGYTAVYSGVYGHVLGGIWPDTHSICCQFQSILTSSLLEFHPFFPCGSSMIPGHCGASPITKDWRCARLCSGNERQRELICLSNAYVHANFPRWFHWTTIKVVQRDTSQRMPGHRHIKDPSPLSAICVFGAHSGGEVYVEIGGVLHSPTQGIPMRLNVHGGGVVDAKA